MRNLTINLTIKIFVLKNRCYRGVHNLFHAGGVEVGRALVARDCRCQQRYRPCSVQGSRVQENIVQGSKETV